MDKSNPNKSINTKIIIKVATLDNEIKRVRHSIAKYNKITRERHNIVLPKGLNVNNTKFQDAEKLTREEYDPTFYLEGIAKVEAVLPTIQKAIETLRQFQDAWKFEPESEYQIILTKYGTGGSYNTKTREIFMRTTEQGNFARPNPAATPIHEITHFCVENLVVKNKLSFSEKEKLVYGIDLTLFPDIFDPENMIPEAERKSSLARLSTLFES